MGEVNYTKLKQKDGSVILLTQYICPSEPKASILILHGMAEHQKRYRAFAEYLTSRGYDVYSYDLRGHGTDRKLNELGFFSSKDGYQLVIQDAISVSEHIAKVNRSSKFFLFAHSMGSIIARNMIQSHDQYSGVILSGSNYPAKFMVHFGLLLSSCIKKLKGPKHISPYLKNLMFGSKKYTSLSSRTVFDWLTRDNPTVGAYMHDPYCGFTCTAAFYHDVLKMVQSEINKKLIMQTNRELPIYVISGSKDPVGGYGREVNKFVNILKKLGFKNLTFKLYPDCRHEILNEINKEEVYRDIDAWISDNC